MNAGTIVLIPFPFAEQTSAKLRPALVIATTQDKYEDIIVCAISSVLPVVTSKYEILLQPDNNNKLRLSSILKIDRIATLKKQDVVTSLGAVTASQLAAIKALLHQFIN